MADVTITTGAQSQTELRQGLWGPYFANDNANDCVVIGIDGGADLTVYTSDDGGATWAADEVVEGNVKRLACYTDMEFPGDTGTSISV